MSNVVIIEPDDRRRADLSQAMNRTATSVMAFDSPLEALLYMSRSTINTVVVGLTTPAALQLQLTPMLKKHAPTARYIFWNESKQPVPEGIEHCNSAEYTADQLAAELGSTEVNLMVAEAPEPPSSKRILVVEDDEDLSRMYEIAFKKKGFDVKVASNGIEGVTQAVEFQPNLILLDIMMPQMDGYEVIQAMRKNTSINTQIVINSNVEQEKELQKAIELGADHYLRKSQHTAFEVVDMVAQGHYPPGQ